MGKLERQLQRSLHHSRCYSTDGGDLSKVRISYGVVWLAEVGMIEGVEHLPTELDVVPIIADLEIFHQGHVPGVRPRSLQDILAAIAEGSRIVRSKSCRVHVLLDPL